jgi:hypothetical protein
MDNHFYGIYRGVCVDNADPDKLYRIRLKVPQVLHTNITNWAYPCLPVTDNANHPDHKPHLAAEVAALLTTTPVSISGSGSGTLGGSVAVTSTVPALTVVALNSNYLNHAHIDSTDPLEVNGTEHTPHRKLPTLNQGVWVMFEGGDPNFPVWMGVY